MDIEQILKSRRKELGISQEEMAHRLGTSRPTYLKFEKNPLTANSIERYLSAVLDILGLTAGQLGIERVYVVANSELNILPVRAYVRNEGELIEAKPGMVELVPVPTGRGTTNLVALKLDTDALAPRFNRGDVIFFVEPIADRPEAHFGKACVVRLRDDRQLVRVIAPGRRSGAVLLRVYAGTDIETDEVVAVAPVLFITTPDGQAAAKRTSS